jgi:UDP-N-acetylglucosamine acyltransferase
VLGVVPQDLKYRGSPALLIIGHNNRIARRVTMHIGTEPGGFVTRVGDNNIFRESSHMAHDCFVDNNTVIGRCVQLAGHILVQDGAVLEDMVGVHHFVTIGRYSRIIAMTPVRRDVPPYTVFGGDNEEAPAVRGINEDGIKAAGLTKDEMNDLRRALGELFEDEAALQTKIEQLVNMGIEGEVSYLCEFCQQSLSGKFGRYREEAYRGLIPPEAAAVLPPEKLSELERILKIK